MTSDSTPKAGRRQSRRPVRGALPENDDDLAAIRNMAGKFGGPAAPDRPPLASVPAGEQPAWQPPAIAPAAHPEPTGDAPPAGGVPGAASAAAHGPYEAETPADGPLEDFIKQATIQVDYDVEKRFRAYQQAEQYRTGVPVPNAEVIFRALEACDGREREVVDARKPRLPEGRRFGRQVPGRRSAARVDRRQVNYRPTIGERSEIKKLSMMSGAATEAEFLNAVLDEFLPRPRGRPAQQPASR